MTTSHWLAALGLALAAPGAALAQEREPFQMISVLAGYSRVAPVEETPFEGEAADAGGTASFALAIERLQARSLYAYGRIDGDAAENRQHLGAAAGLRYEPVRLGGMRPYLGAGLGLLWLEPKITLSGFIDREFALRGEAIVGVDATAVPGLRGFAEYRLTGSRHHAIGTIPDCTAPSRDECLGVSPEQLLHLGHTIWLGLRVKMF